MQKPTSQILMAVGFCPLLFCSFFTVVVSFCPVLCLSIYIYWMVSAGEHDQFPRKEPQSWPSLLRPCHHFPSLLSFKISILIIMQLHKLAVTRHWFVVVWLLFVAVVCFGLACFYFFEWQPLSSSGLKEPRHACLTHLATDSLETQTSPRMTRVFYCPAVPDRAFIAADPSLDPDGKRSGVWI